MKVSEQNFRHDRLRLLATCSALALACAIAVPAQAAPTLTGNVIYTLDGGAAVSDPQSSSIFFDIFPSASAGITGSSIFGHTYAYDTANFGTRGSGNGVYDIDSFSRYQNIITNDTGAAGHYYASFTIQGGEVSARMGALTGTVFGGVTADITVNGSSVFQSAASMSVTDGGTAVFATSGTVLNSGGETTGPNSGSYSWNDYVGYLDLGVLAPGGSVAIDYKLTSHAYSTVAGCTASGYGGGDYGGAAALTVGFDAVVEPGYGGGSVGTSCFEQTSIGRIGDPLDGSYESQPGGFNVSVPEPASTALLGVGLAGLAFMRRRRAEG